MAPFYINEYIWDPMLPHGIVPAPDASQHDYILLQGKPEPTMYQEQHRNLGIEQVQYLEGETWLCKYLPSDLKILRDDPNVLFVDVYHSFLKVHASLRAEDELPQGITTFHYRKTDKNTPVHIAVYIASKQMSDVEKVANTLIRRGTLSENETTLALTSFDTFATPDKFDEIAEFEEVVAIEYFFAITSYLSLCKTATNIPNIMVQDDGAGATRYTHLTGEGEIIQIADSGIDLGSATDIHSAFQSTPPRCIAMFYQSLNGATQRIHSTSDPRMIDSSGHGTIMACCAVGDSRFGNSTDSAGVPGGRTIGAAPMARFVVTKIDYERMHDLNLTWSDAYNLGARITSNSYGPRVRTRQDEVLSYGQINHTADSALFYILYDLVATFAAGNDAMKLDKPFQIGAYCASKNTITVGATHTIRPNLVRSDAAVTTSSSAMAERDPFHVCDFSSRGPTWAKGLTRVKPDLCAPGSLIVAADSRGMINRHPHSVGPANSPFRVISGTSGATAYAAGCAALIRQALKLNNVPKPSAPLVRALLINGAVDTEREEGDPPRIPSWTQGWGRINVDASLAIIDASVAIHEERNNPVHDVHNWGRTHWQSGFFDVKLILHGGTDPASKLQSIGTGQTSSFDIDVPERQKLGAGNLTLGSTLKVTLVWNDPPGINIQNLLGLAVVSSTQPQQRRHGNFRERDMTNEPWHFDCVNNVQQVMWEDIPAGKATVIVACSRLPTGASFAGYALCWSLEG